MIMSRWPVFLSPATPSELATYVSSQCHHPTTLVICTTQAEFDYALNEDMAREMRLHNPGLPQKQNHDDDGDDDPHEPDHVIAGNPDTDTGQEEDLELYAMPGTTEPIWISPLLQPSIHRVAIAKHIRVVFMPSVSHLRAWLTVFPPADPNSVEPPPPPPPAHHPTTFPSRPKITKNPPPPLLLLYGFLDLHRDTSEWSAQGLSSSASTLVEAARDNNGGMRAVVVEPRTDWDGESRGLEDVLGEELPVLSSGSGGGGTAKGDRDEGWSGRAVEVRRVLGRWFRFEAGPWDVLREEHGGGVG